MSLHACDISDATSDESWIFGELITYYIRKSVGRYTGMLKETERERKIKDWKAGDQMLVPALK